MHFWLMYFFAGALVSLLVYHNAGKNYKWDENVSLDWQKVNEIKDNHTPGNIVVDEQLIVYFRNKLVHNPLHNERTIAVWWSDASLSQWFIRMGSQTMLRLWRWHRFRSLSFSFYQRIIAGVSVMHSERDWKDALMSVLSGTTVYTIKI